MNNNDIMIIARKLDPEAFENIGAKSGGTRRYLAEEIVNRLSFLAKFAGCTVEELIARLAS